MPASFVAGTPPLEEKYLRTQQVAALCGVSRFTVWNWSKQPDWPQARRVGRINMWPAAAVWQWIESHTVAPRKQQSPSPRTVAEEVDTIRRHNLLQQQLHESLQKGYHSL